jgi:ParB family chromosome partitioning protein
MPATPAAYKKGKLYDLPIGDLNPDPNQPRKSMDPQALEELTASVKRVGIIQPLLFRVDAESANLNLVAGERRFKAAQLAGLATVPGICVEGNPSEIALVENLLRQDLTSVEEAEALQRLMEEQKYNQEQLAGIIGKARQTINEILLVNRLPQEIRDECRGDRKISRASLIEIARKKQVRGMQTAFNAYKAKQQKGKTTRQKKDPNEPQAFFDMVDKTMTRIQSIDTSAWTDEEKANFQTSLANLKIEINNHLAL